MAKEKKPLFNINTEEATALQMLNGTNKPEEKQETKTEVKTETKPQGETAMGSPKKKTNRGRKRKYEEGEVMKLTLLVDKHLSTTLKMVAKSKGKTIQQVMMPYIEGWLKDNQELENPYFASKNKKYTGFNVSPELRKQFSEACTDREITQSFVAEALYQKAIEDLSK